MGNRSRRTLKDLYVLGQTVTMPVPDAQLDERFADYEVVWVQKLDPLDHTTAVRKAKAARARARATLADEGSDEYLALVDEADQMTEDDQISLLVSEEQMKMEMSSRAELMLDEDSPWSKDGYLDGLMDTWVNAGGLEERYMEDADDPEANRVLAELNRFNDELLAIVGPAAEEMREMAKSKPPAARRVEVIEKLVDREVGMAWLLEFTRQETYLSVRKPCDDCLAVNEEGESDPRPHQSRHNDLYFQDITDVDRSHFLVIAALQRALKDISVDPTEGKGSRATRDSSGSSEQLEMPETELPSGLPVAVG